MHASRTRLAAREYACGYSHHRPHRTDHNRLNLPMTNLRTLLRPSLCAIACMAATACNAGDADEPQDEPQTAPELIEAAPHALAAPPVMPPTIENTGNPAGPAFIFHAKDGFDGQHYNISEYEITENWMGSGFSRRNVNFRDDTMELVISDRPYRSREFTGAEFQRRGFYGYGRYEVVMQGIEGGGVVTSFFTHTHGQFNDPHDEIDFEFLGRNTRQVQLNHFKDGKPAGGQYIDLPFDYTEEMHLYAFEWTPESIKWYVEDELVFEATENLPTAAGRIIINAWVGGHTTDEWLGETDFTSGSTALYKCISHIPAGESGPQCSDTWSPATSN